MQRDKVLLVIGCQKEKLEQVDKKFRNNIIDFINSSVSDYRSIVSIVRKPTNGDTNFRRSENVMSSDNVYLDYPSDNIIVVPGYDVDCSQFRKDIHYDLIGISTSASVLTIAMAMYSCGLDINVLAPYVEDRKGKDLEKAAFQIMDAYMPDVVIGKR